MNEFSEENESLKQQLRQMDTTISDIQNVSLKRIWYILQNKTYYWYAPCEYKLTAKLNLSVCW